MSAVPARMSRPGRRVVHRLLPISAYVGAALVLWLIVTHGLAGGTAATPPPPVAAAVVQKPRPAAAPKRIPAWAYALYRWHSQPASQRGRRPHGVPRPIPDWYWAWRSWRLSLAPASSG